MRPALTLLLATAGVLAGCASVPADDATGVARDQSLRVDGIAPVLATTDAAHDGRRALRSHLLAAPLDEAAAVRLALEASPAMQALLADAWQAQAAAVQAAAAPNPFFAFERIVTGGEVDLTRTLGIGLTELLTLPARRDAAQRTVQGRQWQLARDVLAHTAVVRQQWVRAVAAQQLVAYHRQVRDAAEASAELARRMQAVGNFSRLQRAREQAFLADATAQLARALAASTAEREALVRLLGLDADEAERLALPERLPDLPAEPRTADDVSRRAVEDRLDLRVARLELAAAERGQPLAAAAPWHVELAAVREAGGGEKGRGFEIHLPLPVFDTGRARREAASAQVLAARARFEQARADATSVLRERYVAYRTAHDLARHYRDEVVPLARTVTDEMLLKYNGMLVGVFELLADARAQVHAVIGAIEAQRDFWLAHTALDAAIVGAPAAGAALAGPAAAKAAAKGDH
ncbi:TolC family protein [Calidifontimicrobium sp. SYSU G02091]|uniref:TolC family protein n=1 Tax=Calidifontimicrobium sp. SYSU G02091 TaxID=2926421 RepID=UPI001F52D2B0|nr:TolC family protein [Calidifontimicrobium sp. SYSU G02091]MCI1192975.1 TolC family protein [Calidifontimicrobium sp. SYSU G02091]